MLHYNSVAGEKGTPFLLNKNAGFVIYCRRCHHGLCNGLEIGHIERAHSVHNIVAVEPCETCLAAVREGREPEVIPYPDHYLGWDSE